MLLLAVFISVINTVVFIINPQQLNSVIEEQTVRFFLSNSDGIISTSSRSELMTPDQDLPVYEFKNDRKISVQTSPRFLQLFQSITPVETGTVSKSASGYLKRSSRPELNDVELYILHRRLNT